MQNEVKIDNRKTMVTFFSDDFSAARESRICEYRWEINQSEHGLSFTVVQSWFNSPNSGD